MGVEVRVCTIITGGDTDKCKQIKWIKDGERENLEGLRVLR